MINNIWKIYNMKKPLKNYCKILKTELIVKQFNIILDV